MIYISIEIFKILTEMLEILWDFDRNLWHVERYLQDFDRDIWQPALFFGCYSQNKGIFLI